jgi:hypothetical protein
VPDVDPIITAAWITGGVAAVGIAGTVMSSIVGSRNTRMAAEQTVEAARATTMATLAAAPPFDGRELVAARQDIDAAIADADAMDNLLVTLIREEQRSNGRTVLTGQ